jgi:CubicO group peptidase (beta-lactamase class C family)
MEGSIPRRAPWFWAITVIAVFFCGLSPDSAGGDSTAELVGLWKAKRAFEPGARGHLVIQRTQAGYTAAMMERMWPVHLEKDELRFELPDGQGAFRGKLEKDGALLGHWYPPSSAALMTGFKYASPVHLEPDGSNRWIGEVHPFDEVFTFYLLAQQRADGLFGAVLRNPERDFGAWLGVERIVRGANVVKLIGKRPQETREHELAVGTYDPEDQRIALDFPTRGGRYDFHRDDDESAFYPRGRRPDRYVYRAPPARRDGWPCGSLEEANIDRPAMEKLVQMIVEMPMDSVNAPQIHGVLMARHGKLVLEEYFHGEHRDKPHETRSAAKSLTATLVGAAMQAGVARLELSTPVYQMMNGGEFPADLDPQKRAMTLEHLLTMTSGFFCDDRNPDAPGNEETMLDQTGEPDYYRYTLKVPMDRQPGEKAVYCSADPNLALGVLSRATGESPLYTFDRLLGGPLEIHRYAWLLDPSGQPYGGGSVQFLPRDFMKLGQLMLNGGTWQGRRILSQDFVERASSPQYHLRNIYYGYLWWGIDYPYKDRTVYAFFAGGAGGQAVMVIRELDLVIAIYGGNYSSRGARFVQQELVPRYILPAVREPGDDTNATVTPGDYVSPYGPSPVSGRVTQSRSR